MSILQAARAEALGLPHDSALSWGLNRAIFYAAAKRGFKGALGVGREGERKRKALPIKEAAKTFHLGDELAFVGTEQKKEGKEDLLYFSIGDKLQTPRDFERQIVSRFGSKSAFQKAWDEALDIIRSYDRKTLESQREFYEQVYKPRRDTLAKKWTEMSRA